MNLSRSQKIHYDSGPNMTPLVDIVMVILIFMMLAGTFGGAEHFLAANMDGDGPSRTIVSAPPRIPLDIRVEAVPQGSFLARIGTRQARTSDELNAQLDTLRRQYLEANQNLGDIQVRIYPGRRVGYQSLVTVYDAALRAEFTKVAFATSH